jgi:hypothetical protein
MSSKQLYKKYYLDAEGVFAMNFLSFLCLLAIAGAMSGVSFPNRNIDRYDSNGVC